jgi:hypothetical protein
MMAKWQKDEDKDRQVCEREISDDDDYMDKLYEFFELLRNEFSQKLFGPDYNNSCEYWTCKE